MAVLGVVAVALSGCGLLRGQPSPPRVQIGSLSGITNLDTTAEIVEVLERAVMRYADNYVATMAQAMDDYNAGNVSAEARTEALRWKLSQATAAWIDASGANAALNMLDLVVLSTVSRLVMEEEVKRVYGPEGLPLLETHRQLETNAWAAATRVMKPAQQQQLRDIINEWRRQHPNQRYVAGTRFRELAIAVGQIPERASTGPNSIFSLLFLDPLAGLDPTAAAITETRQLAERAMYYTQRMPMLLNLQVQLMSLQLASQPEAKQLLADANRFTLATEAFAKVADQLPQVVNDQREAAIRQVLEGLATERTNLLASLAAEEQKARALLTEARQTLDAGSGMATSVQGAVKTLDEFVRSVSPTNPAAAATKGKPFDVLDYGQAATQMGSMAQDLQRLLTEVNHTTPGLADLTREATGNAQRVLNRAFWLGLALSLIVLTGAVAAALLYRSVAQKLWPPLPLSSVAPQLQRTTTP